MKTAYMKTYYTKQLIRQQQHIRKLFTRKQIITKHII